ncbi:hypothetical protein M2352_003474 [Azospirillum fermentarium]|uniref:hypothetical protein n=1 Tax=Azospirillum fermentarium TaxID=1233114 RepID=UPI0022264B9C|nr:hypothetical protein [Azospirillum fermentarium]MCW2247840.1 hypothetical protein [Azospirillum fermentarium]
MLTIEQQREQARSTKRQPFEQPQADTEEKGKVPVVDLAGEGEIVVGLIQRRPEGERVETFNTLPEIGCVGLAECVHHHPRK